MDGDLQARQLVAEPMPRCGDRPGDVSVEADQDDANGNVPGARLCRVSG
ncbi:hypothetical protein [Aurantimonas sp. 22II-16-19i]|nr:hypothetical protein [Aurantimonas sp. 22II-16-19i]